MLRVITLISACWNEIPSTTLQKSWRKILLAASVSESTATASARTQQPSPESTASATASARPQLPSSESTGFADFQLIFHTLGYDLNEEEIDAWLRSDQHDLGYTHFTDQDIVSNVIRESTRQESEESDGDDEDSQESPPVSHSSAVKMFDECLQWLQAQEEASIYNICMLQELRELADRKRRNSLKQRKLLDFFNAAPS